MYSRGGAGRGTTTLVAGVRAAGVVVITRNSARD